jgi:hypothetical protein
MLHGSITRGALLEDGSDAYLRREVRAGRLRREHQGVYVDVRRDFDERARWAAALLRAGRDAALSHVTAERVHGIESIQWPTPIHISVPHHRRPRPIAGVVLHRPAFIPDRDRVVRGELLVTSLERTVLDRCGDISDERERVAYVARVLQNGRTTSQRLQDCVERSRPVRGCKQLEQALYLLSPGYETIIETELAAIGRAVGLNLCAQPTIVLDGGIKYRLDLLDEELLLNLEADGERHLNVDVREDDLLRDERLRISGLEVLRFTGRQIRRERRDIAQRLTVVQERRKLQRPQLPRDVVILRSTSR